MQKYNVFDILSRIEYKCENMAAAFGGSYVFVLFCNSSENVENGVFLHISLNFQFSENPLLLTPSLESLSIAIAVKVVESRGFTDSLIFAHLILMRNLAGRTILKLFVTIGCLKVLRVGHVSKPELALYL